MDRQNQNSNQEISILDLLHYFEKIIKKVLSPIGNFFKSFINAILGFFILLKRYYLFILITVIIFGIIGYFNKKVLPRNYNYEMVLAPNFKSTTKLYQQINSYNQLCGNIDSTFFKDLKSISITPIKTFTSELNIFYDIVHKNTDFYKNDTIFSRQYKIDKFKNLLVDTDYPNHIVHIIALNKISPEEIKSRIIHPIENDPFYKRIKEANLKSIDIKTEIYKNGLKLIDSLLLSIAKGDKAKSSNSSISFNGESKTNVEQDLLNKTLELTKSLAEKEVEKVQKSQVITVISEPQLVDSKFLLYKRNTFSFALSGFLFSIFIILFIQFVKFLNKFEKKHS
ncbi:MAG: hypothetical protein J6581_00325 [Apibacter sp.]|nr:hypothetical protein [Apibacter sp.]